MKADVVKANVAARARNGNAARVPFAGLIDKREHRFGGSQSALQRFVDTGDALQRRSQHQHRRDERNKLADGRAFAARLTRRKINNRRQRNAGEQLHHRHAGRGCRGLFHHRAAHIFGLFGKAAGLVTLTAEELDHLVTFDRFLQHLRDIAHCRLHRAARVTQANADHAHDADDHRRHHQRQQRQLPVQIQHPRQQSDQRHRIAKNYGQHAGCRRRDLGNIKCQFRNDIAAGLIIVMRRGQGQQFFEHDSAQIHHQAVAHPVDRVRAHVFGTAAHHDQTQYI